MPARLERQSVGTNRTLRLMIISLSALVALLMPIVHRNTTTRGHEVNRRYEVMRIEDNAFEEEKLFDDGMKPAASGSGDRGTSPATKSRSIWTKHEDVSKKYHVILTSQSSDYLNWQSLVMYYHYKKQREAGGEAGDVGGFTRLVAGSRGSDDISNVVPTKFVLEIDPEKVRTEYKGYSVLNRPYSFKAFLELGLLDREVSEDFIFIAETDHVLMRPMANLATVKTPVAYPFAYMKNMGSELLPMVRSVCPKIRSIESVQPIGPSPTIIHKSLLKRIIPEWYRTSIALKTHPDGYGDMLGWILEMYAFAISCACLGIEFKILESFQVEPTAQSQCTAKDLKDSFIFHYTYPLEFQENGKPMPPNEVGFWSLNKRNYGSNYPPKELTPPPEGAHAGAAFITTAWAEAIGNQSETIWKQSPVTLGTIGWMPKVLTEVEMEQKGLVDLIGSRWSWVYDHERENLHRNPVLVFRTEGVLDNPWGGGTWGEITALPAIHPTIEWKCPRYNPILSLSFGNAVHIVCMSWQKGVMRSIRIPDGALNRGAMVAAASS